MADHWIIEDLGTESDYRASILALADKGHYVEICLVKTLPMAQTMVEALSWMESLEGGFMALPGGVHAQQSKPKRKVGPVEKQPSKRTTRA